MKKAIFSVLCFVAWQVGHAQLTFTPNASLNAICPLVSTTFTINNIPVGCTQYTISLVSGDLASNTTFEVSNNQFTLSAADTPQEMVVRIIPIGGAPCIGQQDFKIPVRSINGQAPTFTGCQDIVIGRSESFNLTAILEYLYAGTSDQKEVAEYEWEIFAGGNNWNLTTINQQGVLRKIAQIVTDI